MIGGLRALIAGAAGAGPLAACLHGDPCASGATCVSLEVDSFEIKTIDQLVVDVVYGEHHGNTTIGTAGDSMDLPFSFGLTLDLPDDPLIQVHLIAAAKLGGHVLGAGGDSTAVQQGHQTSSLVLIEPFTPCVEGELYCGLSLDILGEDSGALYRCTGGVPIFTMQCSNGCDPDTGAHGQCFGGAP